MFLKIVKALALFGVALSFESLLAAPKISTDMLSDLTTNKKFGANIGLGDPFPGLIGVNVGYNLDENVRLTAGYAEVEVTTSISFSENGFASETVKAQTYGVGGQYLFTEWAVRPTAGLHLGYFSVSGSGEFSINGFEESTAHGYSNLGFDWVAQSGFHAATGMNIALVGGSGAGFYANLGYFF